MELVNALYLYQPVKTASDRFKSPIGSLEKDDPYSILALKEAVEALVLLISPFAPHIASELWEALGKGTGLENALWPVFDPELIKSDEILVVVQVNGKVRDRITVPAESADEYVKELALSQDKVRQFMGGKEPKKVIYVKSKLVSIVV